MNSRKMAQQRKHNQLVNQYLDSVAPLQIPSDTVIAPLRSNRSVSIAGQGQQQQQQQQQPSLQMQRRQSAATMGAAQPSSPSNLPAQVSSQSSISSAQSGSNNVSPVPAPNAAFGQASAQAQIQVVAGGAQQVGQASAAASAQAQAYQTRLRQQVQARPLQPAANNQVASSSFLTTGSNPLLTGRVGVVNAYTTALSAAALIPGGSVPEFLYQLTKMLTETKNRDIIEWSTYSGSGRIEVHHPARLEKEVLGRYFRHSKYSSFQRQLNYFGFRKIAGKGKMSPCSYVNDQASTDIRSLLSMKRKNSKEKEKELAEKAAMKEQAQVDAQQIAAGAGKSLLNADGSEIQPATVQPMFCQSYSAASASTSSSPLPSASTESTHKPNKRAKPNPAPSTDGRGYTVAVGKGVKHQLNGYLRTNDNGVVLAPASSSTKPSYLVHPSSQQASATPAPLQFLDPSELGMSIESSLNQLKDAFTAASNSNVASTSAPSAPAMSVASSAAAAVISVNGSSASSSTSSNNSVQSSALTQRISSIASFGGMLSRDDSLINLAMLPTLDDANARGDNNREQNLKSVFSRDDSLVNLAAAVGTSCDASNTNGADKAASTGNNGDENDGSADTFGFIDFSS